MVKGNKRQRKNLEVLKKKKKWMEVDLKKIITSTDKLEAKKMTVCVQLYSQENCPFQKKEKRKESWG